MQQTTLTGVLTRILRLITILTVMVVMMNQLQSNAMFVILMMVKLKEKKKRMIQSLTQAIFLLRQQLVGQVSWVVDLLPLLQVECEALSDILGLMTVSNY